MKFECVFQSIWPNDPPWWLPSFGVLKQCGKFFIAKIRRIHTYSFPLPYMFVYVCTREYNTFMCDRLILMIYDKWMDGNNGVRERTNIDTCIWNVREFLRDNWHFQHLHFYMCIIEESTATAAARPCTSFGSVISNVSVCKRTRMGAYITRLLFEEESPKHHTFCIILFSLAVLTDVNTCTHNKCMCAIEFAELMIALVIHLSDANEKLLTRNASITFVKKAKNAQREK